MKILGILIAGMLMLSVACATDVVAQTPPPKVQISPVSNPVLADCINDAFDEFYRNNSIKPSMYIEYLIAKSELYAMLTCWGFRA